MNAPMLLVLVICTNVFRAYAFNLDTKYPIIFRGAPNTYFGYSVALMWNREGPQALITAPRSNSTILRDQLFEPGVLNSCKISVERNVSQNCAEVLLDKLGNTHVYDQDTHSSYWDKKDNMFLGVSLDIHQNARNGRVVTCGHLWKNQLFPSHYLANGVCYVINDDLDPKSVKKLVPLVEQSKQTLIPPGIYYYAFGQAGTSAVFSEDGKYLFLGAPGFYDWTGTVLSYENPDAGENYGNPIIPNPPGDQNLSPESYIGYSLTSGKFFEDPETYIAAGAPRDKNSFGQVYIIKALRASSNKFLVHMKKEGTQFGEYFGASLMGSDVNNDGLTDLLVGAPLFSLDSGGDEGKVYVYISNGVGLQLHSEISGASKPNARFGSCITNIGDINKDGYNDIAIGAPYEELSGSVYIYHGSYSGLNTQYVQRILASDISPSLSGFGISISRGVDIDGNYYPDILIGSYASSHAVLFRAHPVIQVSAKLEFSPQQINTNATPCEYEGKKLSCINVTVCLQYTGKHSVMNLNFETELYMDFNRQSNAGVLRGYLLYENKQRSVIYRSIKLEILKDLCFTYEAHISPDARDIIFPVDFLFSYRLTKDSTSDQFCKTCPYITPASATNITKSASFQTGCGKDNKCMADLFVEADVVGNPKGVPLIIGKNTTLTLNISVKNIGEPAYLAELFIYLPPETPNVNQDFCSLLTDHQKQEVNASLQCDLGNPLQRNSKILIQIKIDVSKLPASTESIHLLLRAKTASEEITPLDNEIEIPIYFTNVADVSISGTAEHEQIPYEDGEDDSVSIRHTYFVMNYGPSPVEVLSIKLLVPKSLQSGNNLVDFITFKNIEADNGKPLTVPAKCNDSAIEMKPVELDVKKSKDDIFEGGDLVAKKRSNRTSRDAENAKSSNIHKTSQTLTSSNDVTSEKKKDIILDCNTASCIVIHCVASPFFDNRKVARISMSLQLKTSPLIENLDPWYRVQFTTRGQVSILDNSNRIQHENRYPDETAVITTIVRSGPPPSQEIEKWIIFVSIGVGILLLLIILAVLIKIGFFKRQQKEKMQQMKMQADLKEWEPYLVTEEVEGNDGVALNSS